MTVLTTRKVWVRPKQLPAGRTPDLTDEEREHVKLALRFLRTRLGSYAKLRAALGVTRASLVRAVATRGRPGVGLALRAARLAGVPVEDVLSGVWPPAGACPHCGHCEAP